MYTCCYYCLQTCHQARTQALKEEWVQILNKILVDSVADTVDMDIPNKVLSLAVS